MRHSNKKSHKKSHKSSRGHAQKRGHKLPRTQPIVSRPVSTKRYPSHASSTMSLTDLQHMAKIHGIPFGGLKKNQLAEKINYYNR